MDQLKWTIMICILLVAFLVYIVYTLWFVIKFNKTDLIFDRRQRLTHNILVWLIPFLWIMIIKSMTKPTLGSDKYDKTKQEPDFKENEFFGP